MRRWTCNNYVDVFTTRRVSLCPSDRQRLDLAPHGNTRFGLGIFHPFMSGRPEELAPSRVYEVEGVVAGG